MKEEAQISWILLATAMATQKEPTDLNGISMIADGINHAFPTPKELNCSINWLTENSFLEKIGKKYSMTPKGITIYQRASEKTNTLYEVWKKLEIEIKNYA